MERPSDRFRTRLLRRRFAAAAGAVAALAAALAFVFGSWTIETLDEADRSLHRKLGARLALKHGLLLCAPLDAGVPLDEVSGVPLECAGTRTVRGRTGDARRFDGHRHQALVTGLPWSRLAGGGTVFLWADLDAAPHPQSVLRDRATEAPFGLELSADRTLTAMFRDAGGVHGLSAPFPAPGRFVPVGFVFAPGRPAVAVDGVPGGFSPGRAALWIDGREVASAPVDGALSLPSGELAFGASALRPLVGALDDVSVWSRPLSDRELAAASRSGRAAAERLEPWRTRRARAVHAAARAFRTAARVVDRLVPSARGPASLRRDLPELDLVLSKSDERHFLVAHGRSLRAGCRTRAAAREREVLVRWNGRNAAARLSLDDAYGAGDPERPEAARRPSLLLRAGPGVLAPGSGVARLVPPERWSALRPDSPGALPPAPRLVRVLLDGEFRGLYVLEPFDAEGGAWRATGEREGLRPDHLFFGSLPAGSLSAAAETARWRETLSLLRSDPRFPWSGSEARWRMRLHARRRERLGFAPPALSALDLKGNNPSPFYVTNDVDLAAAGPVAEWRSSDPATLDVDGTVRRASCADGLPRVVELRASFGDGSSRVFRFRVMPEAPRLPALFLHVGDPVRRDRFADFSAVRIPAGVGGAEFLPGTAASGGGLRHRGNTSYAHGARRSLSLRFGRPVGWTGAPEPVSRVLLLSGYADPTRLRNALCCDAFAAMRPDAPRGAVPVSWTEVFVNGEWAGVWEQVPRLVDEVSAWAEPVYKVRTPDGLWSRVAADMLERRDAAEAGPAPAGDAYGPFLELARFAVGASDGEFAAGAAAAFDLDALADMVLLLGFTGNADGRVTNQFVVRRRSDGRWLVLPWDCDKTFPWERSRTVLLSNPLYERCLRCVPGFERRVASRWAALRAGALSDAALDRWIDGRAALLAPSMDEDFRLVPPAGFEGTYAQAVEALRASVHDRARRLDDLFAAR